MTYRGEDLDLRTPQTWSGASADFSSGSDYALNGRNRGGTTPRAQPILVDDHVLACSNHAFDVAVAHRAGDVRIEHLLHAMTRIDAASHALETRGIRVAGLRRESATIIASEIPIGLGNSQGRPRRSDEFETVLRLASNIAMRRNGPANVDDVLDALLDMPSDAPGIALLARHGGRAARDREAVLTRDVPREPLLREPLPPISRQSYASEPRSTYVSDTRPMEATERVRKSAPAYYPTEPARPLRTDLVGTTTDGIQNARIDQLENAVRTLTVELTNERNTVANVVQDLQRNLKVERDDTNRFRGGLHDRLQSLEHAVVAAPRDDNEQHLVLDRLAGVERSLDQRFSEMTRPWGVLSDRLQALEQTVIETRTPQAVDTSHLLTPMLDRLVNMERQLRETTADTSRGAMGLVDRLKGLERTLEVSASKTVDLSPIINRLDIIEEAVLGGTIDATSVDKTHDRLRTLEDGLTTLRTQSLQSTASLSNDLKALTTSLVTQTTSGERTQAFITERMQALTSGLASSLERQRTELVAPIHERLNAVASSIDTRMQAVAGLMDRPTADTSGPVLERINAMMSAADARSDAHQRALTSLATTMAERLTTLERQLSDSVTRQTEVQNAHSAELREVHDALIKLNTNQHTLAGSIDQWRLDGVGDVSVIANRLENIEKASTKPLAMMEQLTTSLDTVNKATVERYHRKNRIWYWLFGTDDWLTASWPSQVAAVEAERQSLRGNSLNVPGVTVKITKTQQG
jgi:hypothetical protein